MDNKITNVGEVRQEGHSNYISKAKTTIIKFESRASIKVKDNFYTVGYGEERQIDFDSCNIDKERQLLIDECNKQVDNQVQEICTTFLR